MKAVALVVLLTVCAIDCRNVVPINKNANIDFINMESGGGVRPPVAPVRPTVAVPTPKPQSPPSPTHTQPKTPVAVTTMKPVITVTTVPPTPVKPQVTIKPAQPNQMDLKPVPAKTPAVGGVPTPGYGNVKQLVTFYDSHGKQSMIRPYSYSDAVKRQSSKTN